MTAYHALANTVRAHDIKPIALRFMASVSIQDDGCWHWTGSRHLGYGNCGKEPYGSAKAHRASYLIFKGDIPAGMHVLHSCDVRHCVNPDHLRVGTHTENMRDMVTRGRHKATGGVKIQPGQYAGEAHPRAKLAERDVLQIRARGTLGEPRRLIASDYGVGKSCITRIISRESWSHVA